MQHEGRVVVEVAVVFGHGAVVHQNELVADAAEKMAIVRNEQQGTLKGRKRHSECFTGGHVEVIGRFVQDNQIGLVPDDQRQCKARFFTARKDANQGVNLVAREAEFTEVISQLLLACQRSFALHDVKRRFLGIECF